MTATPVSGADALAALLAGRDQFDKLADKDFAAAAGLLVKKLMNSAGQTADSMTALKSAVGEEIFEKQLKSLTAHQARLLARRLDPSVSDFDVSTAGAACQHIRQVMKGDTPAPQATAAEDAPAETAETPSSDDDAPKPANAYFGRKSFRMD